MTLTRSPKGHYTFRVEDRTYLLKRLASGRWQVTFIRAGGGRPAKAVQS